MRSLFALLSAGPSARLFLAGVVFLALHPSIYKRCGCDVEQLVIPVVDEGFVYSGRVYDFETGAGLPGARLSFDGPERDFEVTTGEDGTYITPRFKGSFQLGVSYDGYHTRTRDIVVEEDRPQFNISLSMYHTSALWIDDADVRAEEPLQNRVSEQYLHLGGPEFPGNQFQTFLRFSVPDLPENARFSYAGFTAWAPSDFRPGARYTLTNIRENWNPAEVNWLNQPAIGTLSVGSLIDEVDVGGAYRLRFDVTRALQYYYKETPPEPIFGVRLNWDQSAIGEIASTEFAGPGTEQALTGFATWYLRGNDFGE